MAQILAFWFGDAGRDRWFESTPEFDALIGHCFGNTIEAAAAGGLDHWAGSPDGAVALCILLDQFPRNAWRGTPRVFAYNAAARRIAVEAIAAGFHARLPPERRLFLYLPLRAQRGSVRPAALLRLDGRPRRRLVARLRPTAPRSHRPLWPLPSPQRHPGSHQHAGGGGVPARAGIVVLGGLGQDRR